VPFAVSFRLELSCGLGYGASCPELRTEICDNLPLHVAIAASPIAFFVAR
jgi:hypothetical protein